MLRLTFQIIFSILWLSLIEYKLEVWPSSIHRYYTKTDLKNSSFCQQVIEYSFPLKMQYRLFFIFHANECLADNNYFQRWLNWACLACAFRQLDHNLLYDRTKRALNIFQIILAQITVLSLSSTLETCLLNTYLLKMYT